ncbi:MAG: DUF2804 domain-containing protein [Polyangiaceae bacterium]
MSDPAPRTPASKPTTHVLAPPMRDVIDPATRQPLQGSFAGPLPPLDYGALGKSLPFRIAHEKAWYYVAIASPEVFVGVAVLRFGYVASTFAFLFERAPSGGPSGHFLTDRSMLAPPFAARYKGEDGIALRWLGDTCRFERSGDFGAFDLEVKMTDFSIAARIEGAPKPTPISAVSALGGGLVQATEKRALLPTSGEVTLAGKRFSLDGAFGGFDRSHGYLPRHTVWRWSFAMGRAETGEAIAWNLVEGFVGESECAVWIDDQLFPVGEARFDFDPGRALRPWRITTTCGALDLTFDPGDIHAEHQDLGLVKTRFLQPVGAYSGTIKIGDRTLRISGVLGVAEDQDATW